MKKRMITCGYILIVLAMLLPNIGVPLGESGIELAEAAGAGEPDGEATTEPSPEPTSTEGEPATPTATSTPSATLPLPTEPNPTASPTIELPLTQPPLLTATITATETPVITPLIPTETTIVLPTETPPMLATGTPAATLEIPTYTPTLLPSETPPITNTIPIPIEGGEIIALDGMLKVVFPPGALPEPVYVYAGAPYYETLPDSLSGSPFEITAFSQLTGQEVKQFLEPITIEYSYNAAQWGEQAPDLLLYYYDEELQDWQSQASVVDTTAQVIRAQSNHLSIWDVSAWDWQTANLPNLNSAQISSFSGSAMYAYPMWVPPGPAGLQPSLALSYNSQVVDGATVQTQASWAGMGWSLDVGHIERDMNGTMDDTSDDTYYLSVGGISTRLLKDSNGYYRTADESFWRVQYTISDTWQVTDKTGMIYIFGESAVITDTLNARAQYPDFDASDCTPPADKLTWWWGVTKVRNIYGQELTYTYSKETQDIDNPKCEGEQLTTTDMAIYPQTIDYPSHYRIGFEYDATRQDYEHDWTHPDGRVFYGKSLLTHLKIYNDSQVLRTYHLTFDTTSGIIFPGYQWSQGGHTLTLMEIQESGLVHTNNISETLPATTFVYSDSLHLTAVENGYGGVASFEYEDEPWHDIETSDDRSFDNPTYACYDESPAPWQARNGDSVSCTDQQQPSLRRLKVNGHADYEDVPIGWLQPGGVYYLTAKIRKDTGSGSINVGVGIDYGTGSQNVGAGVTTTEQTLVLILTVPADATQLTLFINCAGWCRLHSMNLSRMPTKYRVETKIYHDEITGKDTNTQYYYDEPATNDSQHSDYVKNNDENELYTKPYTEFRGHAMVRAMGPDGRVTTTFYHQDDTKLGSAHTSLITTQDFYDQFDTSSSNWGYSGTNPTIERLAGDMALKSTNASENWNQSFYRVGNTLSDGDNLMVQFRLSGEYVQARLMVANNTNSDRWGISINNGVVSSRVELNGNATETQLLSGFQKDHWYVLIIGVDNDQFTVRIWDRDDPNIASEATNTNLPDDLTWHFIQWTSNGSSWIDEYSEGQLYSQDISIYTSQTYSLTLPVTYTISMTEITYADLVVNWAYAITSTNFTFGEDAEYVGRRTEYVYDEQTSYTSEYDDHVYGNLTHVFESTWNSSTWVKYRATRSRYYPHDDGEDYLVGLPASVNRFTCSGGVCDLEIQDTLASTWYLYDDANTFSSAPVTGTLTGQRTLVCFADDNNTCYDSYNSTLHRRIYNDVGYEYDTWGNPTQVKRYSGYGWADDNYESQLATTGEQVTITTYDSEYHTYPISGEDPMGNTTSLAYDYDFGVPVTITDTNNVVSYAQYDDFGRPVKVARPGDDIDTSPTLEFAYNDTAVPFWTEARQKVDDSTYITVRKIYNGLGQLLQQQTTGAVLADGSCSEADTSPDTCDTVIDYDSDIVNRIVRQTVPYAIAIWDGNNPETPYRGQGFNEVSFGQTEYDVWGRTVTITATDATTQTFTYNLGYINNNPFLETCTQNAKGNQACSQSDLWGRTLQVTPKNEYGDVISPTLTYAYNEMNQLIHVWQGEIQTDLFYDLAGRKTQMNDPDMGTWKYYYNGLNSLMGQLDAKDQMITMSYDESGRLTSKMAVDEWTNGLSDTFDTKDTTKWNWSTFQTVPYSDNGNNVVKSAGDGNGTWNAHFYRKTYSLSTGKAIQLRFKVDDDSTEAIFAIEANDSTYRRFSAKANNGRLYVEYTLDGTNYYSPADLLTTLQLDTWYVLQIVVDDVSGFTIQVYQESDPSVRGFYRMAMTTGKNWRFHHWIRYDNAYIDNYYELKPVIYSYDQGTNGIGRRTGMSDLSGSTAWSYDNRGRMTEESKVISGSGTFITEWSYNSADQVVTMTYPGGNGGQAGEQVKYFYQPQMAFNNLCSYNGSSCTYYYVQKTDYDAAGRVVRRNIGADNMAAQPVFYMDFNYNPWDEQGGLLESMQTYKPNTNPLEYRQNLEYTYDELGNITQINDQVAGETIEYEYDELNRLTSVSGDYSETYTYDEETGNLLGKGDLTYTYPDTDQPQPHGVTEVDVPPSSTNTYSYDDNGNMTSRSVGGSSYTLNYSAENLLMSVSGAATASFVYDGNGQRVKATAGGATTVYIGEYYEWTSAGNTRYYYAGGQRIGMRRANYGSSNGLFWLLSDHLGSSTIKTTAGGDYPGEIRYEPFGKDRYTSGTMLTDLLFTGQRLEEQIGLYYFHARWYDAALGRFVQADSIISEPGNPADFDRYAYVRNNPLKYTDPTGHDICNSDGFCPFMYKDGMWITHQRKTIPLITETPLPKDIIRITQGIGLQDGTPGYNGLRYLVLYEQGWWWADGSFTIQEAIAILLFWEASAFIETFNGVTTLPQVIIDAFAYKWQRNCGGGWNTSDCFIGFWSYFEPLINASQLIDILSNPVIPWDVYMKAALEILNHPIIPVSTKAPQGWVSINPSQNDIYSYLMSIINDPPFAFFGIEDGDIFIVMTVDQQNSLCHLFNLLDMCNLTNAP